MCSPVVLLHWGLLLYSGKVSFQALHTTCKTMRTCLWRHRHVLSCNFPSSTSSPTSSSPHVAWCCSPAIYNALIVLCTPLHHTVPLLNILNLLHDLLGLDRTSVGYTNTVYRCPIYCPCGTNVQNCEYYTIVLYIQCLPAWGMHSCLGYLDATWHERPVHTKAKHDASSDVPEAHVSATYRISFSNDPCRRQMHWVSIDECSTSGAPAAPALPMTRAACTAPPLQRPALQGRYLFRMLHGGGLG